MSGGYSYYRDYEREQRKIVTLTFMYDRLDFYRDNERIGKLPGGITTFATEWYDFATKDYEDFLSEHQDFYLEFESYAADWFNGIRNRKKCPPELVWLFFPDEKAVADDSEISIVTRMDL